MKILFWGLTIFCLSFFLHLVVWKVCLPKRHTKILLEIFFGTLGISLVILQSTSSSFSKFDLFALHSFSEYLHLCIFFGSLVFAYILFYPAIEVDSPSIVMVLKISEAGSKGLDEDVFKQELTDDILIKPRIKDLLTDKMAYIEGEKYKPTLKGILFVRIFILYRKLLNVPKGG